MSTPIVEPTRTDAARPSPHQRFEGGILPGVGDPATTGAARASKEPVPPRLGDVARAGVRASASSSALWNRSMGLLARHRSIVDVRLAGRPGRTPPTGGAISSTCISTSARRESASNGKRPVIAKKPVTPREYRSLRASTSPPITCSGLTYSGVPIVFPPVAELTPTEGIAIPKSVTMARPVESSIRMLSGFTSW